MDSQQLQPCRPSLQIPTLFPLSLSLYQSSPSSLFCSLLLLTSHIELALLSVASGTLASYSAALETYNAFCYFCALDPLCAEGINAYILQCFSNGDSVGRAMSAYSALLLWAKIENYSLQLPPVTLMSLKAFKRLYQRSRPAQWVTLEDLQKLLSLWQDVQLPYWTLLVLSFYTLIRPAEILNILWKQVFFSEEYIYLPWSKNDPDGHGTYVKLLPQALSALKQLRDSLPGLPVPNSRIFSMPQSSLNPWLSSQCQKAKVGPFTWYHLKHGGATHFALLGWSFSKIKRHGRWKSDQAARLYIHAPVSL